MPTAGEIIVAEVLALLEAASPGLTERAGDVRAELFATHRKEIGKLKPLPLDLLERFG